MEWIRIEDKKPTEKDGLIVVSFENGFKEIVYVRNKELIKPWRFDENDFPASRMEDIKYWLKLTEPNN